MELVIQTEEGVGTDLYRWLTADEDLAPDGRITPADAGRAGDMGIGFDVLNLVIPNAIALGSLITSVAAFREQHRESTGAAPQIGVGHASPQVTVGHVDTFVMIENDGSEALRQLTIPPASQ
jgi:hypothetical protein